MSEDNQNRGRSRLRDQVEQETFDEVLAKEWLEENDYGVLVGNPRIKFRKRAAAALEGLAQFARENRFFTLLGGVSILVSFAQIAVAGSGVAERILNNDESCGEVSFPPVVTEADGVKTTIRRTEVCGVHVKETTSIEVARSDENTREWTFLEDLDGNGTWDRSHHTLRGTRTLPGGTTQRLDIDESDYTVVLDQLKLIRGHLKHD